MVFGKKIINPKRKIKSGPMVRSTAPTLSRPMASQQPAVAYGAVQGRRRQLPLIAGMADTMMCTNFEQVGTVTGNGSFSGSSINLNPGDSGVFTWLSNIALNYQKFRWKFLRFIYVPQVPATTAGSAYVFLEYDYLDALPTTLAQVTASADSCTGNVWFGGPIDESAAFRPDVTTSDFISITANPNEYSQKWYYVRNASNAETLATIQFSSTTNSGAITVGQNGASPVAIPTGGTVSTLVSIPDTTAIPVRCKFGCNNVTNSLVAGYVYAAYQCELASPVAPASQN